jgi:hypothetical protein
MIVFQDRPDRFLQIGGLDFSTLPLPCTIFLVLTPLVRVPDGQAGFPSKG